jgi:hypothetical protein
VKPVAWTVSCIVYAAPDVLISPVIVTLSMLMLPFNRLLKKAL